MIIDQNASIGPLNGFCTSKRGGSNVIESEGGPAVLIVDQDLGFVFWLGEILIEAGCSVVPALDCTEAVSITEKLDLTVDVVIMDPGLPWVQHVLSTLTRTGRTLKIVAISDDKVDAIWPIHADAILKRPIASRYLSRQEMLEQVQEILREIQIID